MHDVFNNLQEGLDTIIVKLALRSRERYVVTINPELYESIRLTLAMAILLASVTLVTTEFTHKNAFAD